MIKTIIQDRESLNIQATQEVSSKWANTQALNGPILSIPLLYSLSTNVEKKETILKYFHILPEKLNIKADLTPTILKRGIYKVIVYKTEIAIWGNFRMKENYDHSNMIEVKWSDAFITMGISDLRGIEEELTFLWGQEKLKVESGSKISSINSALTVPVNDLSADHKNSIPFELNIKIQGSQNLSFTPLGSVTNVNLSSSWTSPSFNGTFLPDNREVTDEGFTADWKVLQLNRNFPESWTGPSHFNEMLESSFGVDLKSDIGDYQKSTRSAKYGAMIIALTFLIFFLSEIVHGHTIHPFQYILVGLAICLFFILLVALSEHMSYNMAYLVSVASILTMVCSYSISVFRRDKMTYFLAFSMITIYTFLYVTLQSKDYALVMGSIGLTAILGLTMYFTRNIDWYGRNNESE